MLQKNVIGKIRKKWITLIKNSQIFKFNVQTKTRRIFLVDSLN